MVNILISIAFELEWIGAALRCLVDDDIVELSIRARAAWLGLIVCVFLAVGGGVRGLSKSLAWLNLIFIFVFDGNYQWQ